LDRVLTKTDVLPLEDEIKGKYVVLKAEHLSPQFRTAKHQVVLAKSGFGCSASARGRAVYTQTLDGGESLEYYSRFDFLGMPKPEVLAELGVQS
jgi:hypothetical protein